MIQHELLGHEIDTAVLVEAASAYLEVARKEAEARGRQADARFLHGDFATIADQVPEADVVTLDRVVCCYPDYRRLLAASAEKSRSACVLSFPRDRWCVRMVVALQNLVRRIARDPFRTFVHPPEDIDRILAGSGLALANAHDSFVWRVALYMRARAPRQ